MALTKSQLNDVCCYNDDNRCLYLHEDFNEDEDVVYLCTKLTKDKALIDESYFRNNSESYHGNCPGYLKLYNIKQGYDVDYV